MAKTSDTLYQIADDEIRRCISSYLKLTKSTKGLSAVTPKNLKDERARTILLAGLGETGASCTAAEACEEWKRRQAIPFDLEAAITFGVYRNIRQCGEQFFDDVETGTSGFTSFDPSYIQTNPHLLPIFQHLSGVFSKSALKKQVGSVSDTAISGPAAKRLADLLSQRVDPSRILKGEILKRLEST